MAVDDMAKATKRGPQGPPGPPGPRGPRGKPGQRGEQGVRGQGASANRGTLLTEVNGHIEDIYRELNVQLQRMSQIQRQVDELREKVKRLSE